MVRLPQGVTKKPEPFSPTGEGIRRYGRDLQNYEAGRRRGLTVTDPTVMKKGHQMKLTGSSFLIQNTQKEAIVHTTQSRAGNCLLQNEQEETRQLYRK